MTKKFFLLLLIVGIAFGFGLYNLKSVQANSMVALADLDSGDLIRGETFPAVYYFAEDGFRYVFPNDKTYFTWYENFDTVKWISDEDLTKIQIGGNVTYRPGVKMIKINTDPKTYAVDANGELRHVTSEQVAIDLYGSAWNTEIDDVPDGFFSNYQSGGSPINNASDFDKTSVTAASPDINTDKDLEAPMDVTVYDGDYASSSVTIDAGNGVRWTNVGADNHTVTADDLTWGSGTMAPGVNYIRKFENPGTYTYFDSYNPSMTGVINVQ
ncbi:MAG: hypothetical protein ABIG32_03135 [Candidatus Uhrbacteria bacterium]|nr:cupredoxin domain-containing protein [Patescibacteria group bacterium]MBU1906562.1 cupredoxin domain-containing protein [Patescibacteria group bacterium]